MRSLYHSNGHTESTRISKPTYLSGLGPLLQDQHVGVDRVGGDAPRVGQQGAPAAAGPARLRPDAPGADARVAGLLLFGPSMKSDFWMVG